jgi:hypothetical protein
MRRVFVPSKAGCAIGVAENAPNVASGRRRDHDVVGHNRCCNPLSPTQIFFRGATRTARADHERLERGGDPGRPA